MHAVSSGSVTINEDSSVQILAEEACSVDQLDAQVTFVSTETVENGRITLCHCRIAVKLRTTTDMRGPRAMIMNEIMMAFYGLSSNRHVYICAQRYD